MSKKIMALLLALTMALGCAGASAETIKHERVFIVTDAQGGVQSLTDSVRLENQDKLDEIVDRTMLTDVQNVGGHEAFTLDGETLTWQAQGNEIIYQGVSDKTPDVLPVVRLTLDGEEVTAAALATQAGKVTMTVEYTQAAAPALAVSLMALPTKGVSNIVTENAAVLNEAGQQLLIGYALPGIAEEVGLPASFSVTFQADHVDLGWMMTLVTAGPIDAAFKEVDSRIHVNLQKELDNAIALLTAMEKGEKLPMALGKIGVAALTVNTFNSGVKELDDSAKELADGAAELADGTSQLADGAAKLDESMGQLNDGIAELSTGAQTLSDGVAGVQAGAAQLSAGLDALTANNDTLNQGAQAIFAAVLETANGQPEFRPHGALKLRLISFHRLRNPKIIGITRPAYCRICG